MELNFDFSRVNLQYLIQFRDIARQNPTLAATVLGLPHELANMLAEASLETLVGVNQIKAPLFVPRSQPWWWSRLLLALRDAQQEEVAVVVEHANLAVLGSAISEQ